MLPVLLQATVDDLTRNAAAQREQLRAKQAAADKAMNDITEALSLASDRKREVEVLQVCNLCDALIAQL